MTSTPTPSPTPTPTNPGPLIVHDLLHDIWGRRHLIADQRGERSGLAFLLFRSEARDSPSAASFRRSLAI
jgi:hypothetical protein